MGPFFSLNEHIFPEMIKEFYTNLTFSENEPWATSLIKGRKIEMSPELLAEVLRCPNDGIERYYSHQEVLYEGYFREQVIRALMEGKSNSMDVLKMIISNCVVLSVINNMVIL